MDRHRRRLVALGGLGLLVAALFATCRRPAPPPRPDPPLDLPAATAGAPAAIASSPSAAATRRAPAVATMTPAGAQAPTPSAMALALEGATPTPEPTLPPTLTGGENDESTWREYWLLSWGISFRYPRQWSVAVLAPQSPAEPEILEVSGGGRALRLMRQAPPRSTEGALRREPVAVGPVTGERYLWQGPQGQLYEAVIVPQARRDAIALVQYALRGGDEDQVYMALFDAVVATLRFDVGVTPAGPSQPAFAPYQPRQVTLPARHPGYALPVDLTRLEGLEEWGLSRAQVAALAANGFFVAPDSEREFAPLYERLRAQGRPLFVTGDSVLHVCHLLTAKALRSAERAHLAPDLASLSRQFLATAQATYQAARGTAAESAAARALAYFAVAVALQDPQAALPSAVEDVVRRELALIDGQQGTAISPLMDRPDLPEDRKHREDYGQYVARGHYAQNEDLQRYFRAMTWYGRVTFRLQDPEEARTALLICQVLLRTRVGSRPALSVWESIYEPSTFFAGRSDDLTVYDVRNLATSLYGGLGEDPRAFADPARVDVFVRAAQALPGPRINSLWLWQGQDPQAAGRGFRLFGQRLAVDDGLLGQLVWQRVGTQEKPRLLPRGLDLAAALGSDEAYRLLEELGDAAYARYPQQMARVRGEVAALPQATAGENLTWAWLDACRPLLRPRDARYPEFMRTPAWMRKDLQTMLAGWAELKHDTVLYAKQPYATGMVEPPPVAGYVEPNPELYARLAALVDMTATGLGNRALLGAGERAALERLLSLLAGLQAIAEKELAGQPLADEEQALISGYSQELAALTRAAADTPDDSGGPEEQGAALIVDVATGGPSG